MSKFPKWLTAVIILFIVGFCAYSCTAGQYNKLVALEENVDSAWADVQNQYQRRLDLIPNLVSTVKGYAKHENEVFTNI